VSEIRSTDAPKIISAKNEHYEYQARTEAMLNSLGEGLIATDEHGAITMVNVYAMKALGYEEKDLIGKWMPKTIVAVDQSGNPLDSLSRPVIKALTTGQTISSYSFYLTKSGSVIPVHINVSPIIIGGLPTGAIEVFRDLTREQQLDVAKDEFVSLASHQLRTPATAVKSILSMLANGDFGELTPVQRKYLDKAVISNDRQLQVIEDLLNVALVDAGRMELDLEYMDLDALMHDAITDLMSTIDRRHQTVQLQAPHQLKLLADHKKLRMAIDNLIGNASKYSAEGAMITVRLEQSGEQAKLHVIDQGVGIPSDMLPNIFAKFTRLPNEMSSKVGGTGLGLFLTRSIVEMHRGRLTVRSEEGKGSTFTISLPTKWSLAA
jgi:two-component system sensor histidine kinase VicK